METIIEKTDCIGCGVCEYECPNSAITIENNVAAINQDQCESCGSCIVICPVGAIIQIGDGNEKGN